MKSTAIFETDALPSESSRWLKLVRFWAWVTTPAAPNLEEAEARLAKAGPFYTDAQKAALHNPDIPEICGSLRSKK